MRAFYLQLPFVHGVYHQMPSFFDVCQRIFLPIRPVLIFASSDANCDYCRGVAHRVEVRKWREFVDWLGSGSARGNLLEDVSVTL